MGLVKCLPDPEVEDAAFLGESDDEDDLRLHASFPWCDTLPTTQINGHPPFRRKTEMREFVVDFDHVGESVPEEMRLQG